MKQAIVSLLFAATAAAQPSFEVASIKPNISDDRNSSSRISATSLVMRNWSLREIVLKAYDLKDYALNAPDWLASPRFDINASAAGTMTEAEMHQMLQSLLAERFQLKSHRESRLTPAYVLLPAKGGFKLTPGNGDGSNINWSSGPGNPKATCTQISMVRLAGFLSGQVDRPVVDQSGIPDAYDFALEWSREQNAGDAGPSISTALKEQLGLRLESRKLPISILVVDSIIKTPTEN
jgi:uncharacterized protein (TIGR03435 family)